MAFVQGVNTSTTVWRNGQADTVQLDGHDALLRALVTFAAGKASLSVSYSGTGNGKINFLDGGVAAPSETWTVTMTGPTGFSVTGSVSGGQSAGTTGNLYTTTGDPLTSLITFQIDVGGTAFVVSDAFSIVATVTTVPAADRWVLDRWNPDDLTSEAGALNWHGLGDGTEAIHMGIRKHDNAPSSIWNWNMRGYTGFSAGSEFSTQPGKSGLYYVAWWNNDMLYWFSVNSRRYIVAAKVSSGYHCMYQGLMLPFGSPTEFPYPAVVFGEKDDEEPYTSTADDFNHFMVPSDNGALRDTAGTWLVSKDSDATANFHVWPRQTSHANPGSVWDSHENLGGDHQLMPLLLAQGPTGGVFDPLSLTAFGVMDGANIVTGDGNSAETVLSVGGTNWVVFQNIFRSARNEFWAMEMA